MGRHTIKSYMIMYLKIVNYFQISNCYQLVTQQKLAKEESIYQEGKNKEYQSLGQFIHKQISI